MCTIHCLQLVAPHLVRHVKRVNVQGTLLGRLGINRRLGEIAAYALMSSVAFQIASGEVALTSHRPTVIPRYLTD